MKIRLVYEAKRDGLDCICSDYLEESYLEDYTNLNDAIQDFLKEKQGKFCRVTIELEDGHDVVIKEIPYIL